MNCDRIARAYRWMEYLTFGAALHKRRRAFLYQLASTKSVLILGDGDGRFTADFLESNRIAQVDSIEMSGRMTQLAAARIAKCSQGLARVRQFQGDAQQVELCRTYDLVVTHFFLDCFEEKELQALIRRINLRLMPTGMWLISEFRIPRRPGRRKAIATLLVRGLYFSFRWMTGLRVQRLPDYARIMQASGLRCISSETAFGGMLVSELWERGELGI